jgi:serine beta-lactamase-like protein LACTB, mitochondrial
MTDNVWKKRAQTAFVVIFSGIGLIFLFVLGLWLYVIATAKPLHPNPQDVPTVQRSAPPEKLAGAVEQARQIARAALVEGNWPGFSVAVGAGGNILWAEGFGWADLDKKAKVEPETPFRIGTASIALTSAAAGLLIEKRQLHLDADIQTYVPAFPQKQWPVTLRQLMGHVAGVRNDGGDEGELLSQHCERPSDGLRAFADSPLRFEPGTEFRYSSYGWILVSAAVESAAGEPFLAFMKRQVFDPLGMENTVADPVTGLSPIRATSYFPRFAAEPRYGPDVMRPIDYSCYAGASVFLSTPSDLVRFGMAINGGKLLKPETVRTLQTPLQLASGTDTGYALGWNIETPTLAGKQTRLVGHDGELLGGMAVSLLTFPEHGLVVAVTSNTSFADTYALGVKIAEAFAKK